MKQITSEEASIASAPNITWGKSAFAISTVKPPVLGLKSNLSLRFKRLLSKLSKALEGDHEFHHYLGG